MDVHLRDLRYFVAVAEELHFTRAAERLHVSQPALSRQIAKLESDLRLTLLNRDRRNVELSAAGEVLLTHVQTLLATWDEARSDASDAAAAAGAVLRVGQQTTVAHGIIEDFVASMRMRRPTWTIELRHVRWDDPSAGLDDGTSDVAVCWLPIPEPDRYCSYVVTTTPIVIALPTDHPVANAGAVEFETIEDVPLLALPDDAGPLRDFWLAIHARSGRPPTIAGIVAAADETLDAVGAGFGGALMAATNADLYERPSVTFVPVNDLPPARVAIVWRADDDRAVIRDAADIAAILHQQLDASS